MGFQLWKTINGKINKMKKALAALLIAVVMNAGFAYVQTCCAELKWDDTSAKVGYIQQREYYQTLLKLVHQAKKEIVISMFLIDYTKRGDDPIVVKLVDALVNAQRRGVKVKVVLENTILLNNRAYVRLVKNGVEVLWDHDSQITHAKLIVIDRKYSVVGSNNWTERAFRMNNEAALLVESEAVAGTILAELGKQKVMDIEGAKRARNKDVIFVPKEFLLVKEYAPRMLSASAERAYDLYVLLLKMSQDRVGTGAFRSTVTVDYEVVAQHFGDLERKGIDNYKRGIRKELSKLEKKYGLIEWKREYGKLPKIRLLDLSEAGAALKIKKREAIRIPKSYWEYGYAKELSHTAKFFYLINLHETDMSPIQPWWSMAQEAIAQKYHVKRRSIYTGGKELKERNILEIDYARTAKDKKGEFAMRPPNKYKLNALVSETQAAGTYDALKAEYGETDFLEAKAMAAQLDELNDPLVIETILDLITIYGLDAVKDAVAVPAEYKADNSMKHIRYVIGILQRKQDIE